MLQTVVAGWKVRTGRGLDHEGKHYPMGAPIPRIQQCPNFDSLRALGWIIPNIPDDDMAEIPIGAKAMDAREEAESLADAGAPASKRKALLKKRPRRKKRAKA